MLRISLLRSERGAEARGTRPRNRPTRDPTGAAALTTWA
jgi:hypothetical protein